MVILFASKKYMPGRSGHAGANLKTSKLDREMLSLAQDRIQPDDFPEAAENMKLLARHSCPLSATFREYQRLKGIH